jgi:hypothetical protein
MSSHDCLRSQSDARCTAQTKEESFVCGCCACPVHSPRITPPTNRRRGSSAAEQRFQRTRRPALSVLTRFRNEIRVHTSLCSTQHVTIRLVVSRLVPQQMSPRVENRVAAIVVVHANMEKASSALIPLLVPLSSFLDSRICMHGNFLRNLSTAARSRNEALPMAKITHAMQRIFA